MSSWEMVKLRVKILEIQLGVVRGGRLFWLFVFNWLASLILLFVLGLLFHYWSLVVVAVVFDIWFIKCVNITEFWNRLGGLKNG